MTALLSNLAKTLTPQKLLDSIRRLDPALGQKLQGVLSAGFTVDHIMKILDKPENQTRFKDKIAKSQVEHANPLVEAESIRKGARAEDLATQYGKKAQQVGKGAALAAGYLGTRGLSSLFDMPSEMGMPHPGPQAPTTPQPQAAPPAGQGTPQTPGPLTPQVPRTPNPRHASLIKEMGIENVIEGLADKEDPKTISQVLEQHFIKPAQKKWLSEQTNEPLENVVADYLSERPKPPESAEAEPAELAEEPETSNAVLTPSGDIGSLASEDKGISKVDVDGKQKQFRDQDVIKAPIPEKDMADIYEELISKIPESERSAVINVAGYDPNHNELIFMPHTGALYVYKDIPPEFAEKLQGAMFKAKTTGENLYGAWSEGESSRFAGLSKLIKELQTLYGGKGKEYVRKYEKIYDFLAIPKAALKEKEKRKREEERARQGKKQRKPRSS